MIEHEKEGVGMTFERYQFFYNEAMKIQSRPEIALAIEGHTKLSMDAQEKAKKRYELEDRLSEIYHSIPVEGIDDVIFGGQDMPEHERQIRLMKLWLENDPKLNVIDEAVTKSGKKEEIARLEAELEEAMLDYFLALIKLDSAIDEARRNLFSAEYKEKMKEYADNGVLLYFLETPDAPILSVGITPDDFLESLSFRRFMSLKQLFSRFADEENPSPSMRRKRDDILSTLDCMEAGYYRSAARNVFALLESEHKNCSAAMDNYFSLDKEEKKGAKRAEKIQKLLDGLKEQTYFSQVWELINPIYKDILNSKAESFIDRNSIIHGDYYSEKMDIAEKDVIKLMLLFINMRMISDHLQLYCEMRRISLNYAEIQLAQELKKTIK